MGKARAQRLLEKYGPNEKNLNNTCNEVREHQKLMNKASKQARKNTQFVHAIKKLSKTVKKAQVRQRHLTERRLKILGMYPQKTVEEGTIITEGLKKVDKFLGGLEQVNTLPPLEHESTCGLANCGQHPKKDEVHG